MDGECWRRHSERDHTGQLGDEAEGDPATQPWGHQPSGDGTTGVANRSRSRPSNRSAAATMAATAMIRIYRRERGRWAAIVSRTAARRSAVRATSTSQVSSIASLIVAPSATISAVCSSEAGLT